MDPLRKLILLSMLLIIADSALPTCYSAVLKLAKGITVSMERLEKFPVTRRCVAHLPDTFFALQKACVLVKLRDHVYALENLITPKCKELKRIAFLKLRMERLYHLISRLCRRDLVFFIDDCPALEYPPPPPTEPPDSLK
ncbi:LOW QUALITY PROTEIN: cytokine-like protein 1 [Narcine bancroftii]|uniref:LOW QUALITY PROTEIN: cytokine-like protein 1 n=1 Tax=Narcine bancroftii TaxID=1343680 RepID=UPI003832219A